MSGKHTPGNWQEDGITISAGYGKTICVMGEIDGFESGYTPCHNHKANARLIAAAPDLLALAYQYRDDLRHPPTPDSRERRLSAIEAVLSKAGA